MLKNKEKYQFKVFISNREMQGKNPQVLSATHDADKLNRAAYND